jgi:ribosome-binding protein aMBF1 (putative translation factor)
MQYTLIDYQELIFATLEAQGRKKAWLAKQLGVSAQMVNHYRARTSPMPAERIRRACELLGLPYREEPTP